MQKLFKQKIEFYITNVCNFNCDNCNRLNNYYFAGHDLWTDNAGLYAQWADKIDFGSITILGGEPTLNPDLDQWVIGLRNLWSHAEMDVLTNGTRLQYWHQRGFFDLLAELKVSLSVSLHNRARRTHLLDEIKSLLINPVQTLRPSPGPDWIDAYNQIKDASWPLCHGPEQFKTLPSWIQQECKDTHGIDPENWLASTGMVNLKDERGVNVDVTYYEDFVTAPLKYGGQDKFHVYDSKPDMAHEVCWSKHCTHMMRGKMYKCHHVALLPEFAKQFNVEMTPEQTDLLTRYQPLRADAGIDTMQSFLQALPNMIPQCSLCPSKLDTVKLAATKNKPRIKKKVFGIKSVQ